MRHKLSGIVRTSGSVENLFYLAQAVAAACVLIVFGPLLANLFGLMSETEAFGCAETASLSLALPGLAAFAFVAVLSLVTLARGPQELRFRMLIWYVLGPGLLTASVLLDPEKMNAFSPAYDTLALVSLIAACALPIFWLRTSRA